MTTNQQTNGYGPQMFEQVHGYGRLTNEQPASERAELIRKLRDTAAQQKRCHYAIFKSAELMEQAAALLEADAQTAHGLKE